MDERASARTAVLEIAPLAVAVAVGLFLVAFENGSFDPRHRFEFALVVTWALATVTAVGTVDVRGLSQTARLGIVALSLLAGLTAVSATWADDTGTAVAESARTFGYVAVFALAALARSRTALRAWLLGLACGTTAVVLIALVSRLFPQTFTDRGLAAALPGVGGRLSFPLGYWNALGTLVALTVPLLLALSHAAANAVARSIAVGVVPAAAATLYLTSSRGAAAALLVGVAVAVLLVSDRWAMLGRVVVAGAGSALAVAIVGSRHALANDPQAAAAVGQGRSAFVLVLLVCVSSAAAFAAAASVIGDRRPSRGVGAAVLALCVVAAVGALVAVHPVERARAFAQPPAAAPSVAGNFAQAHLLSGAGNGRWQFWSAAAAEWRTHPLLGGGAGSFGAWWLGHGSFRYAVQDAHSLYVETLAELGVVGLVLLVVFGGAVTAAALAAARHAPPRRRTIAAGLGGLVAAYGVAAALDWTWEVPGVTVPMFVAGGLLVGPLLSPSALPDKGGAARRAAVSALAALVAASVGVLLIAQLALDASRRQAAAGALKGAAAAARTANALEPWSADPELQLGLVLERAGDYRAAAVAVRRAVDRSPGDWRIRFVAARIATEEGRVAEARAQLGVARQLDPRAAFLGG